MLQCKERFEGTPFFHFANIFASKMRFADTPPPQQQMVLRIVKRTTE